MTFKSTIWRFCLPSLLMLISSTLRSEPEKSLRGFVVDRLSMVMTGKPATAAAIKDYEIGAKTLLEIAESYKLHPRFEDELAKYWTQTLGISKPTAWLEFPWVNQTNGNLTPYTIDSINFKNSVGGTPKPPFYSIGNAAGGYSTACDRAMFPDPTIQVGKYFSMPYANASLDATQQARILPGISQCGCSAARTPAHIPVPVNPWWNPTVKVLACPGLLDADVCGQNLQNCWPGFDTFNQINDWIAYSLAMEPGYLAAKTIIENKPWSEVLTTKDGVGNAAFLTFLHKKDVSIEYYKLSGGTDPFPNLDHNPKLAAALADPSGKALLAQTGSEFARYQRAAHHSGVLTTPGFVKQFNGARAFANASRQAFLCRDFVVPDGVAQVPDAEPDLTKKAFCKTCHITLEPLSEFWRAWPRVGEDTAYYYYPTGRSSNGSYDGKSGSGVADLAHIYTETNDFATCAVKRSFDFFIGRPMSKEEEAAILPSLTNLYKAKGGKVWPVMLEIIASPIFAGEKKGN